MDDNEFRKRLLSTKKTERIIFAATPELKTALETVAADKCISVSALITQSVVSELTENKDLVSEALS